jgi:TonB family protein
VTSPEPSASFEGIVRSVVGMQLVVAGCAATVAPASTPPPDPPRAGLVADAQPVDGRLPSVGEFVIVRGGEHLFARPEAKAPSITLPADPDPFIGPIPARAIDVGDGFVEVEMLGRDAASHCGVVGTYADELRGFVRIASLADVTTTSSRATLRGDVVIDIPAGIAVENAGSGATIETDGERFAIPIDPAVVGRSYATRPDHCLDESMDTLVAPSRVPPSFEVGRITRPRVQAWFETGEPLGTLEPPRDEELGPPPPNHPSRRCFEFAALSGAADDATVCVEPRERKQGPPYPVPRVEHGKHRVQGPLDPDIVRRIVRAHINEIRRCYNQGLRRDATLRGTVTVSFDVLADGKVGRARVESTTLPDPGVGSCMAAAVGRWVFPKPTGGKKVKVTYPFELAPPP